MKRIRINKGTVGLVFRNGEYQRALNAGSYWLWGEKVEIFDMSKPFTPTVDLNLLLEDSKLASMLEIVEVQDNEIALQFINGNYKNVLRPGRYAFWKGLTQYRFQKADLSKIEISAEIPAHLLHMPEVLNYIRVYVVESYEKGVLMVDGKAVKMLDKGVYYFWKNPMPIAVIKADLRQLQLEISGQDILTKDKAALRVNFFLRYKVVDIKKALFDNKDFEKQLYVMVQLAIREFVGMNTLDEILERKESVANSVLSEIGNKVASLGVEILDCGIRDIILPGDVKEIMNQVLIAEKKAQANIITRREETASTRSLLNTAKLMEENAMLFKLKEMEYIEKITDKVNTISLAGGGQILDQLKGLFTVK